MARIGYLKENIYHNNWIGTGAKFLDVYDSKDGFEGEMALGVQMKDGITGYIPLTENAVRGSRICIIGRTGKTYRLAVQKKKIYDEVAYCQITLSSGADSYVTIGSNYVQLSVRGVSTGISRRIYLKFYNDQNEELTSYSKYVEDDISMIITINAYLTFSGSGNGYNFQYDDSEILGTVSGSYTNRDVTITTKFDNTKKNEDKEFFISASTPNTSNSTVNKITFKQITINGRNIPIRMA